MYSSTGLGITTSRKIVGGRVVEEKVVQLPTIEELREKLSYRGSEDQSFRWRGEILAYGEWDANEKVYSLSNPVFSGMQFPTWQKAFDFLDGEKEAILLELEKLAIIEEDA
jgi:hypothetical protein|tara:strand:+ start:834 stop:1166 length:333 start_codon:yes stop_codon:yes gene_type:complete